MQKAWNWTKENAGTLAALGGVLLGVIGIVQFGVLNPIHQRFDAMDRRFDRLENDVSELRNLSDRVSHNEGQIDVIRQQLQTADTPSP